MMTESSKQLFPERLSRNQFLELADKFDTQCAKLLGWTNLHGAPPEGAYLRGTPPWKRHTGNVISVPRFITALLHAHCVHMWDHEQGSMTDSEAYEQYLRALSHIRE